MINFSVEVTEATLFRDNVPYNHAIESSLDNTRANSSPVRVAQPIYFAALSSLLSSVFPSAVQQTTTETSTVTAYAGGTKVVTVFTGTTSYTLIGSCYPVYPPVC